MINTTPLANISPIMTNQKSKSKISVAIARRFNVRDWIDWNRIKSGSRYIKNGVKQVFIHTPTHPTESFVEAQRRMKLTNDSLASRARALLRISILMLALSVALFGYSVYHFLFGSIHSGILTLSLTLVSLTFAFRYHFWYFQITQRKLGCTFSEWFHEGLMGNKP